MTSKQTQLYGEVDASPTKNFFVSMLTRDVTLLDAVLDLLDNCVDGILRNELESHTSSPYKKFFAQIDFNPERFFIHDNCGGIPWALKDYAFRMGKPKNAPAEEHPTVGVYGIGMKRAVFKMGQSCSIQTQSNSDRYEIEIGQSWLQDESDDGWGLTAKPTSSKMKEDGTTIIVHNLHPAIAESFGKGGHEFESELVEAISTHYAQIISKGFKISINGKVVSPKELRFSFARKEKAAIQPYLFTSTYQGVDIFVAVGFTRPIPDQNEQEEEISDPKYSKESAGWTVICNDRVVLYADKSERTGWGTSRVPRFHPQFIAISGIVQFSAKDASKLPTLTTKRGLDMNSTLYLQVRERMVEGMKLFTDFTNKWKFDPDTAKEIIRESELKTINELRTEVPKFQKQFKASRSVIGGKYFIPNLPMPKTIASNMKKISFSRSKKEIDELSNFFGGLDILGPSEVGEKAFDFTLSQARKS